MTLYPLFDSAAISAQERKKRGKSVSSKAEGRGKGREDVRYLHPYHKSGHPCAINTVGASLTPPLQS